MSKQISKIVQKQPLQAGFEWKAGDLFVVFGLFEDLATPIITIGANVMTLMNFTSGLFRGKRRP
ncbi:MAG: hypothetical protein ACI9SC_003108 [Gammaproteobacteria bacterium]|jgi:hypothetical protein